MEDWIKALRDSERELGPYQGVSDADIVAYEQERGFKLPRAYRDFLRVCGRDSRNLILGSWHSFDDKEKIRAEAKGILQDMSAPVMLSDDLEVVLTHQGYTFIAISLSDGDDPQVYASPDPGGDEFLLGPSSFSAYIYDIVQFALRAPRIGWI